MLRCGLMGLVFALLPGAAGAQVLWELSAGRSDAAGVQYVVVRAPGGAPLTGLTLAVEDAFGVAQGAFAILEGAAEFVVVATPEAAAYYGFTPDQVAGGAALSAGSGRLCLLAEAAVLDCVGYGAFAQSEGGLPAPALLDDQALTRVNTTGFDSVDFVVDYDPDPAAYAAPQPIDGGVADAGVDAGPAPGADGGAPVQPSIPAPGGKQHEPEAGCAAAAGSALPGLLLVAILSAWRPRRR